MPGLIGKTAQVASTDPATGEPISLTISPEGVINLSPATAVSSIVVPGMTANCESCVANQTGSESAVCSQMHYFASPGSAEKWVQNHPDVAILTVHEAFELVQDVWLEQRAKASQIPSTDSHPLQENHNDNCCTA